MVASIYCAWLEGYRLERHEEDPNGLSSDRNLKFSRTKLHTDHQEAQLDFMPPYWCCLEEADPCWGMVLPDPEKQA